MLMISLSLSLSLNLCKIHLVNIRLSFLCWFFSVNADDCRSVPNMDHENFPLYGGVLYLEIEQCISMIETSVLC